MGSALSEALFVLATLGTSLLLGGVATVWGLRLILHVQERGLRRRDDDPTHRR